MINLRQAIPPLKININNRPLELAEEADIANSSQFGRGWASAGMSEQGADLMWEANQAAIAGDTALAQGLRQQGEDIMRRAQSWAPTVQNFTDIQGPGDAVDWALGSAGNIRSSAMPALGGLAGAAVGGLGGLAVGGLPGAAAGATWGARTGAGLAGYNTMTEGNAAQSMMDPTIAATRTPEEIRDVSRLTGAAQGALEAIVPAGMATSIVKGAGKTAAKELAEQGAKRYIAKKAGLEGAEEFATEFLQNPIGDMGQNYLAGNDMTDVDWKAAFNAGMAGFAPGAMMGGVGATADVMHDTVGGAAKTVANVARDPVGAVIDKMKRGAEAAGAEQVGQDPVRDREMAGEMYKHIYGDKGWSEKPATLRGMHEEMQAKAQDDRFTSPVSKDLSDEQVSANIRADAEHWYKKILTSPARTFGPHEGKLRDAAAQYGSDKDPYAFRSVLKEYGLRKDQSDMSASFDKDGTKFSEMSDEGKELNSLSSAWLNNEGKRFSNYFDDSDEAKGLGAKLFGWIKADFGKQYNDGEMFIPRAFVDALGERAPGVIESAITAARKEGWDIKDAGDAVKTLREYVASNEGDVGFLKGAIRYSQEKNWSQKMIQQFAKELRQKQGRIDKEDYKWLKSQVTDPAAVLQHFQQPSGFYKADKNQLLRSGSPKTQAGMDVDGESLELSVDRDGEVVSESSSASAGITDNDGDWGSSVSEFDGDSKPTFIGNTLEGYPFDTTDERQVAKKNAKLGEYANDPAAFAREIGVWQQAKRAAKGDKKLLAEYEDALIREHGNSLSDARFEGELNPVDLTDGERDTILGLINKRFRVVEVETTKSANDMAFDKKEVHLKEADPRDQELGPSKGILRFQRYNKDGSPIGRLFVTSTQMLIGGMFKSKDSNGASSKYYEGTAQEMLQLLSDGVASLLQDPSFGGEGRPAKIAFTVKLDGTPRWADAKNIKSWPKNLVLFRDKEGRRHTLGEALAQIEEQAEKSQKEMRNELRTINWNRVYLSHLDDTSEGAENYKAAVAKARGKVKQEREKVSSAIYGDNDNLVRRLYEHYAGMGVIPKVPSFTLDFDPDTLNPHNKLTIKEKKPWEKVEDLKQLLDLSTDKELRGRIVRARKLAWKREFAESNALWKELVDSGKLQAAGIVTDVEVGRGNQVDEGQVGPDDLSAYDPDYIKRTDEGRMRSKSLEYEAQSVIGTPKKLTTEGSSVNVRGKAVNVSSGVKSLSGDALKSFPTLTSTDAQNLLAEKLQAAKDWVTSVMLGGVEPLLAAIGKMDLQQVRITEAALFGLLDLHQTKLAKQYFNGSLRDALAFLKSGQENRSVVEAAVAKRKLELKKGSFENPIVGDIWAQKGYVVVSTNLGGVHGRGLAKQAKDKGLISSQNRDFDSSPNDKKVLLVAVKGREPSTAKLEGRAFSEQVVGKNVDLLKAEIAKVVEFAKANPNEKIYLPYVGLGFGEGNVSEIGPILAEAAFVPNIFMVTKDESTVQKYAESFKPGVRRDATTRADAGATTTASDGKLVDAAKPPAFAKAKEKEGNTKQVVVNESPASGYRDRTKHNADSADVTIAFAADHGTAGERLTARLAGDKLVKFEKSAKEFAEAIVAKLKSVNGTSINVAGNGIYTWAKYGKTQEQINEAMFKILKTVKGAHPKLNRIVTGGQTGSDIAGAIAARALGIPVEVTMPRGFLQRGTDGKDFTQTREDVLRQIEDGAAALERVSTPAETRADTGSTTAPDPQTAKQDAFVFKIANMSMKDMRTYVDNLPFDKLQRVWNGLDTFYPVDNENAFWQRHDLETYREQQDKMIRAAQYRIEDRLAEESDVETDGDTKYSEQKSNNPLTEPMKPDEAVAYLERVFGKDFDVEVVESLGGHAGLWTPHGIMLATSAVNGVQYHEALHEFFSQLRKHGSESVAQLIERVATNPIIMRKLEQLLEGHPKALKQLKTPEEAAAFMFQFWNMGLINIGPETKTLFQTIKDFIAKVAKKLLSYVDTEFRDKYNAEKRANKDKEKALFAFETLNSGVVADPSRRHEVYDSLRKNVEAHNKAMDDLGRGVEKFWQKLGQVVVSNEAMLGLYKKHPELQALASKFHQTHGKSMANQGREGGPEARGGYLEATHTQSGLWLNKLENILDGYDQKDMELALKYLEEGTGNSADAKIAKLVNGIRGFYGEMYDYTVQSDVRRLDPTSELRWVPVDKRKDYFTQVWDTEAVMGGHDKFIEKLLTIHPKELKHMADQANAEIAAWRKNFDDSKLSPTAKLEVEKQKDAFKKSGKIAGKYEFAEITPEAVAETIYTRLLNSAGLLDMHESEWSLGITPGAAAVNRRELNWLDKEAFSEFKSKDLVNITTTYARSMVKRAEYQKRFGYGGELIGEAVDTALLRELGGNELVKESRLALGWAIKEWRKEAAGWHKDNPGVPYPEPYPTLRMVGIELHRNNVGVDAANEALIKAEKELRPAINAIKGMEGTLGADISPAMRNFNSWVTSYQNVRLLPFMLFTNLSDVIGITVQGGTLGDAWNAFVEGMREIRATWKGEKSNTDLQRRAQEWGVVDAGALLDSLGQAYGSVFMSQKAKRFNDKFFRIIGAEGWNRGIRATAANVGERIILDWVKDGVDFKKPGEKERFERLYGEGATAKSIKLDSSGNLDVNNAANRAAINRFVADAIMTSNAAHRTAWMSNPKFATFSHLKNFAYTFHRVMLLNVLDQARLGNFRPALVASLGYAPIAIAAGAIKEMLIPGEEPPWMQGGLDGYLEYGYGQANLGGVAQLWGEAITDLDPAKMAGPFWDQIQNTISSPLPGIKLNLSPIDGETEILRDQEWDVELAKALPAGNVLSRAFKG